MPFCADRSVRDKTWAVRPDGGPAQAPAGIHPAAAAIARRRGIEDLDSYFRPNFRSSMPDPDVLDGMREASARICDAIEAGETIGVVGDYDVDGASSTATVVRFLGLLGHSAVTWTIPHRIADGYGPTDDIMRTLVGGEGASLVLLLDSGTTSSGPIAVARSLGADVLVLDHHEAGSELPDAVLVNPKLPGRDRTYEYLCTAGLAFLFCVAVRRELRARGFYAARSIQEPDINCLLGLVALGTIADVVPLVGLNRAYVAMGLERLREIPGIRALMDATGEPNVTPYSCGFVFGPCLNAAGRLDDMRLGAELLVTEDGKRAAALATRLSELNTERQGMQKEAVEQAKAMADPALAVIVLHDESWHPGIVGLVAAKVREAFDRPAVIIGAGGKGSCRSVDGFHVGNAVIAARELGILSRGGGHGAAAGLTIDPARIPDLVRHLEAALDGFAAPPVPVDLVVPCGTLNPALVNGFDSLAPFGQGNTKPRVAVVGGYVRRIQILKELHVKAWLSGPEGETEVLAFNGIGTPLGEALRFAEGRRVDIMGTVEVNSYRGIDKAFVKPEDIMLGASLDAAEAA